MVDNQIRKNNVSLKGLKEGTEGQDLKGYLEELFMDCTGSDCSTEIKIVNALQTNHIGRPSSNATQDVLITLTKWQAKLAG